MTLSYHSLFPLRRKPLGPILLPDGPASSRKDCTGGADKVGGCESHECWNCWWHRHSERWKRGKWRQIGKRLLKRKEIKRKERNE